MKIKLFNNAYNFDIIKKSLLSIIDYDIYN